MINDFYNHQLLSDKFLNLLVKFSPVSLFEIQINLRQLNNKSLNLFFNNWRNRKSLCLYYLRSCRTKDAFQSDLINY